MKRIIVSVCVLALTVAAQAQTYYMKVHLKGGSTDSYAIGDVQKITFSGLNGISGPAAGNLNRVFRPLLLLQNRPNPFSLSSTIEYNLPSDGVVELGIYNITGQLVRTLAAGQQEAGPHAVTWDARDNAGRRVANGAYIYHLKHNQGTLARRMILIK